MTDEESLYDLCRRFAYTHAARDDRLVDEDALGSAAGYGLAQALLTFRPGGAALSSHAYACVRGAVTSALRRGERWRQHLARPAADWQEPSWTPPHETRLAVRSHLWRLPSTLRETVWLRHAEEYTVVEIARHQERSRSAVHRDLRAAMTLLREAFGRHPSAR